MIFKLINEYKDNSFFKYSYKILKIFLPVIILIILFKFSYITLEPIKLLFISGDFYFIIKILFLSFLLCFLLYFRWMFCINIYKLNLNISKLIKISSQAYSIASFVPGQVGIDALRIGKLRKIDSTKFKTRLIKSTLIEKFFALLSQIFMIILFIFSSINFKILISILFFVTVYFLIRFLKLFKNYNFINKYISEVNYKDIYLLLSFSIFCNFVSCYLIYIIAKALNMSNSFSVISISSTLSNISSVIPISPNGIGISEYIFSEITQNISNINNDGSVATIYFSYRIFLLSCHFLIYYIFHYLSLAKYNK